MCSWEATHISAYFCPGLSRCQSPCHAWPRWSQPAKPSQLLPARLHSQRQPEERRPEPTAEPGAGRGRRRGNSPVLPVQPVLTRSFSAPGPLLPKGSSATASTRGTAGRGAPAKEASGRRGSCAEPQAAGGGRGRSPARSVSLQHWNRVRGPRFQTQGEEESDVFGGQNIPAGS